MQGGYEISPNYRYGTTRVPSPVKIERTSLNNSLTITLSSPSKLRDDDGNSDADIQVQSKMSTCRICLDDGGRMISPCGCRGSVEFVHEKCMRDWIIKSHGNYILKNRDPLGHVQCYMCSQTVYYGIRRKYACSCLYFKYQAQHVTKSFVIRLLTLIFLLVAGTFLLVVTNGGLASGTQGAYEIGTGLFAISVAITIILFLVFIWLLVMFLKDFAMKPSIEIHDIGSTEPNSYENPRENQVVPSVTRLRL